MPDSVMHSTAPGNVSDEPTLPIPPLPAGQTATQAILRSVAIGAVAGMRSMTPLALLAAAAQEPGTPIAQAVARMPLLRHLRSRGALVGFGLAALGELIGDKLPFIPARVSFGPVLARVVIGAAAGAVASSASGGSAERGAKRGAASAFLAAWFGYTARTQLSRRTPLPDPVWGAVEDALAIGVGIAALLPSLAPSVRFLRVEFSGDRA